MARATTPTWLSLDRWAQILGINPLHFSQLFSSVIPASNCSDAWTQFAYQNPNYTSREDIAQAIRDAEMKIASELGYFLLPDWVVDERRQTVRPARPELFSRSSVNVRGLAKSIETDWGYVISGGQRAQVLIDDSVAVTVSDVDGDGYDERAVATVATAVTSPCEIRAFLPGQAGSFAYEIRPITVTIAAGVATITFNRWQLVIPELQDRLDAEQPDQRIDGDADASYETTIDVYRVWNDPQSQANLLWEREPSGCSNCNGSGCAECSFSTQTGCLAVRNERLGELTYRPATWDSVDEQFDTAEFAVCRDPEQLRVWYYAGWQSTDPRVSCPRVQLDPYWEKAIVYLSAALLDRELCSCNNVEKFVEHWREDLSRTGSEVSYQISEADLLNPFGPSRGGVYAWRQVQRDGRRIRK